MQVLLELINGFSCARLGGDASLRQLSLQSKHILWQSGGCQALLVGSTVLSHYRPMLSSY
jgi:hypothetical protein